jgi:hypothetical protein
MHTDGHQAEQHYDWQSLHSVDDDGILPSGNSKFIDGKVSNQEKLDYDLKRLESKKKSQPANPQNTSVVIDDVLDEIRKERCPQITRIDANKGGDQCGMNCGFGSVGQPILMLPPSENSP